MRAIAVCRLPLSKTPASSAQFAIAAGDALAQPRRARSGNAAGVRPSPSPPKTASPGSGQGCPAFRPVVRFSVAAETSLESVAPGAAFKERVALRRHPGGRAVAAECATPTPSLIRYGDRRQSPPRLFRLETARRPCGRRRLARMGSALRAPWKDSMSPENTPTTRPIYPKADKTPSPQTSPKTPTLLVFPATGQGATPALHRSRHRQARCHAVAGRSVHHMHRPSVSPIIHFSPRSRKEVGLRFEKCLPALPNFRTASIRACFRLPCRLFFAVRWNYP